MKLRRRPKPLPQITEEQARAQLYPHRAGALVYFDWLLIRHYINPYRREMGEKEDRRPCLDLTGIGDLP